MQVLKSLQDSVKQIEQMYADYEDLGLLIEMSQEEQDEETVQEIEEELLRFEGEFEELRIQTLLTGEYDRDHAIVTLHAGAGGTESCDWANMLYRMYTRWAEKKGFSVEVLDYLEGDSGCIEDCRPFRCGCKDYDSVQAGSSVCILGDLFLYW